MAYKLLRDKRVLRLLDGACLPCLYDAGALTALDEFSPFVRELSAWLAAGNVPLPADPVPPPDPRLVADEQEQAAAKLDAQILNLVNATPQQLDTFATNNFPSLATAGEKARMGTILKILAVAVRPHVR